MCIRDSHKILVTVTDEGGATATAVGIAGGKEDPLPPGTAGTDNQLFLAEVYHDLLHREIDPLGLSVWGSLLDAGMSRPAVVAMIEDSPVSRNGQPNGIPEYRRVQVNDLFLQYLHRNADPQGLEYFSGLLEAGDTVEQVTALIVSSPEYIQDNGGTPTGFVQGLFRDALATPLDAATANASLYGQALAGGQTPAQVATFLFAQNGYHQALVLGYYQKYLDRGVTSLDEVAFWTNMLNQGMRDEAVIALFVGGDTAMNLSNEFFNKTASNPI